MNQEFNSDRSMRVGTIDEISHFNSPIVCPNCFGQNDYGARSCTYCGTSLMDFYNELNPEDISVPVHSMSGIEPAEPEMPNREWEKRKRKLTIALIIAFILMGAFPILGIGFLLFGTVIMDCLYDVIDVSKLLFDPGIFLNVFAALIPPFSFILEICNFIAIYLLIRALIKENYKYGAVLMQICPFCNKKIPEGKVRCPKCGADLMHRPKGE